MKEQKTAKEYIPFGEEWKDELMKVSKQHIISLYRSACLSLEEFRHAQSVQPQQTLDREKVVEMMLEWIDPKLYLPPVMAKDDVHKGLPFSITVDVLLSDGQKDEAFYAFDEREWLNAESETNYHPYDVAVTHWKFQD